MGPTSPTTWSRSGAASRVYFYTPVFITVATDDTPEAIAPGKDEGDGVVSALAELPPGMNLDYDESVPRFMIRAPAGTVGLPGWEAKTKDEINADYPGLIP